MGVSVALLSLERSFLAKHTVSKGKHRRGKGERRQLSLSAKPNQSWSSVGSFMSLSDLEVTAYRAVAP